MAYDEGLAERIRQVLGEQPGLVEKKMFGACSTGLEKSLLPSGCTAILQQFYVF